MAKARAIVIRRKAVQNIRKITKTMELIATARFKKRRTAPRRLARTPRRSPRSFPILARKPRRLRIPCWPSESQSRTPCSSC